MEIALKNEIGMGTVVSLLPTETSDLDDFKLALQASFRVAAEADFGGPLDEPIPSDRDIEQSACRVRLCIGLWREVSGLGVRLL